MAKDIRNSLRQVLDNDAARMIVATAAGELIRRAPAPGRKAKAGVPHLPGSEERLPPPVLSGIGGFAAGAGAATLVQVSARGVGKLVRKGRRRALFSDVPKKAAAGTRRAVAPSLEAVDAFASRLGTRGGSGTDSQSRRTPARSRTRRRSSSSAKRTAPAKRSTTTKRPTANRSTSARPTANRSTTKRPTANRSTSARPTANRSTSARPTAKRRTNANGSTARASAKRTPTAKRSSNANGSNGRTRSKSTSRKPART